MSSFKLAPLRRIKGYLALLFLFVGYVTLQLKQMSKLIIVTVNTATSGLQTISNHTKDISNKEDEFIFDRSEKRGDREDNSNKAIPIWSAAAVFTKQREGHNHSNSIQEFRIPGRGNIGPMRRATEFLTYGLGGILPYYGEILPALEYKGSTFHNTSEVKISVIPNASLVVLDLQECQQGRKTKDGDIVRDGNYNVCYFPTREDSKDTNINHKYWANCFHGERKKMKGMRNFDYQRRFHNLPAPGHELWSCSDRHVMEQLVAAQALDFLIYHTDRFSRRATNNVFFLEHQRPVKFVSIDHDGVLLNDYFRNQSYEERVKVKLLLGFDLPRKLRADLQRVRLRSSKEEFVRSFNASLDGQLGQLTGVLVQIWSKTPKKFLYKTYQTPPNATALTDILWTRFESLVNFYNITRED